jgi:hypothetical protein
MLIFEPIKNIFNGIKKDEILLPHYDIITKKIENNRYRTSVKNYNKKQNTDKTKIHMRKNYL